MKKSYNLLLLSFLVLATPFLGYAQNVGVDVASPVQKLDVAGGLRIGTTVNGVAGSIRWNGTNFQVHNGTTWINFGGGEVNSVTAGNGLLGGGTGGALTLDVNVDGTTIQINADILRVPSGGISTTQILDGTILTGDISTGGVTSSNILDGTILATDIATGAVATAEILDATILPADVAAGAVNTVLSTNSSGVVGWNNPATLTTVLQDRDADTRINVDNGGSPDDDHIRMTTVNVERVTIDNTGEVGIGTNTPNRNLHVVDATGGKVLVSRGDVNTNLGETLGEIMFDSEDDTDPSTVDASAVIRGIAAENHGNSNKGGDLAFLTKQIAAGGSTTAATERMRILSTGNVGIGTTTPGFKLHVAGDFHPDGKIVVQDQVDGGSARGIWLWDEADSNWGVYMGQSGAGKSLSGGTAVGGGGFAAHAIRTRVANAASQGIIFENSAESLLFSVRGSDGQTYHKGNVGINTDPSAKLHILVADDQNDNPANNGIYVQSNDVSGDNGDAIITARVAGAGGGDPFFSMDVTGVAGWTMGLDNSDADKLKFANSWSNPGINTRLTIQTDGNVGVGDDSPSYKLEVYGTTHLSRDNAAECCAGGDATLSIAESTTSTGRRASIQFHNGGEAEGKIQLAQGYNMAGLPYTNRRMHFFDNQNNGLGLELEGNLFYGNNSSRTQTRDNNTLAGNSDGVLSGFYETSSATIAEGYPENASWYHLIDTRHSSSGNNYAMQIAGSFFDQDFWVRKTNGNGATAWSKMVTSNTLFTTFIQWGRTDCPASSSVSLIYSGYAGGSHAGHSGSGSNLLCLSPSPDWTGSSVNDADHNGGLVYGVEWEASGYGVAPLAGFQNYDARCGQCLVTGNSATLMVPGTVACPAGWARQYWGYLMSSHYTQQKSEFVCVANNPTANGSNGSSDGNLWYPVETELGALQPPYVQNRELVCAVCTR